MTTAATGVSTWTIDPIHSMVTFALEHLTVSTFKGRFRTVEGTLKIDEANPTNSSVTASIDVKSIDVVGDRLYGRMMELDFFDAEHYPHLTFQSTGVEKVDDQHWKITGDLTIKATTRHVVLDTLYRGQAKSPFSGKMSAAFAAETEINRADFDLKWNAVMDSGAPYLGERVHITLEVEAVRQD